MRPSSHTCAALPPRRVRAHRPPNTPSARCQVSAVAAAGLEAGAPAITILDLCSGFGFLGMFLSEMLPPAAVERIVLLDKRWPEWGRETGEGQQTTEHVRADGWPIPLFTRKNNIKASRELRQIRQRVVDAAKGRTLILGVHLCGALSIKAVELFNTSPRALGLVLKPCCLPGRMAVRQELEWTIGGGARAARGGRVAPHAPSQGTTLQPPSCTKRRPPTVGGQGCCGAQAIAGLGSPSPSPTTWNRATGTGTTARRCASDAADARRAKLGRSTCSRASTPPSLRGPSAWTGSWCSRGTRSTGSSLPGAPKICSRSPQLPPANLLLPSGAPTSSRSGSRAGTMRPTRTCRPASPGPSGAPAMWGGAPCRVAGSPGGQAFWGMWVREYAAPVDGRLHVHDGVALARL